MTAQPEARKAPMLDPDQARKDAKTVHSLAESRRTLAEEAVRSKHLARSADLYERADLYSRLASYAEESARLKEGIEKVKQIAENVTCADYPDDDYWRPFFDGESSLACRMIDELAALLGEGDAGGAG